MLFRSQANTNSAVLLISQAAAQEHLKERLGLHKQTLVVKGCRNVSKKDLVLNDATPIITVDPERYEVRVNGQHITCEPAERVPLAQRYFLF